jgi:indolepyruvate ferredoxin oxidoreductase
MLLVGHAWQQGLIPVSEQALLQAITLNGVAVEGNKQAFAAGRFLAERGLGQRDEPSSEPVPAETVAALIESRAAQLADYQNADYAAGYRHFVDLCVTAECRALGDGFEGVFAKTVAKSLFKLMAYKDEYEVARLYSRPGFIQSIRRQFDGEVSLRFHLAPPFLARPREGQVIPQKITFGPWMMQIFHMLARLRFLRGTAFDPFGYSADRRLERQLIDEYKAMMVRLLPSLSVRTLNTATRLASLPDAMRGFGHVKQASVDEAKREQTRLLDEFASLSDPLPKSIQNVA